MRAKRYRPRRYLMCAPQFFDVTYSINAWMDVGVPVDNQLARQQWQRLVQTLSLIHISEPTRPY